jgi:hypothetical protein
MTCTYNQFKRKVKQNYLDGGLCLDIMLGEITLLTLCIFLFATACMYSPSIYPPFILANNVFTWY